MIILIEGKRRASSKFVIVRNYTSGVLDDPYHFTPPSVSRADMHRYVYSMDFITTIYLGPITILRLLHEQVLEMPALNSLPEARKISIILCR